MRILSNVITKAGDYSKNWMENRSNEAKHDGMKITIKTFPQNSGKSPHELKYYMGSNLL